MSMDIDMLNKIKADIIAIQTSVQEERSELEKAREEIRIEIKALDLARSNLYEELDHVKRIKEEILEIQKQVNMDKKELETARAQIRNEIDELKIKKDGHKEREESLLDFFATQETRMASIESIQNNQNEVIENMTPLIHRETIFVQESKDISTAKRILKLEGQKHIITNMQTSDKICIEIQISFFKV